MDPTALSFSALLEQFILNLILALIIFFAGRWVAMVTRNLVRRIMKHRQVDETLAGFTASLVYVGLLVFFIIAALAKLGLQTASFIAVVGAMGLAIGLAMQGSLSNFAAGVMLLIYKPFSIGNYIEGGGTAGIIEEIGIFHTTMRSPDNRRIIVPNSKLTADNITNFSANETRRVDLVVGVGYDADLDHVRSVLEAVLGADGRILADPEPTIAVVELGESSVNFAVRPWVNAADWWPVFTELQAEIKKRFDAEGISIPFPQRDVHLYQAQGA